MIITNTARALEPPEPKIIGYCPVCGGEIYEYEHSEINGKPVCDDCAEFEKSESAVIEFIEAFPDKFFEFLRIGKEDGDIVSKILDAYGEDMREELDEWLTR
jgi:hypothetical protein